jgi:hypothetical protein
MHKEENSPTYLPLSILEKVAIISLHNNNYLVFTMQAIDADGTYIYHFYSIVVKVGS